MEYDKLLATVGKILDDLDIPYVVTGGYATSVWGRIRSTLDIDVVIELAPPKIKILKEALQAISQISYIDEEAMKEALERKGEFNFIYPELGTKVDFFVRDDSLFKEQIKRKVPIKVEEQNIYFLSPEDLILAKLTWYKESQSSRQIEDVESIIKRQKKLDWPYLKKWARIQETDEILESLKAKIKND